MCDIITVMKREGSETMTLGETRCGIDATIIRRMFDAISMI